MIFVYRVNAQHHSLLLDQIGDVNMGANHG